MRKIAVGVGSADVVDAARAFSAIGSGRKLNGPIALMKPSGPPSWLAPLSDITMIERVVAYACRLQERDEARKMPVGMIEHAGEGRLQPREDAPLVDGVILPGLHAVVARRHPRLLRHQPHRLLARQPLITLDVPAMRECRVVARG